uniref:B30.2/SPRY domain-containing protein n=1 Tax=Rhodosorus marinus TaxID=101924 RepID=A0A7S2ZEG6_9RHOD|mmetsp:Transcript_16633/g.68156  ORF Transcript_16633/g.68156 Transcript_16633/m.68156 type:complete len:403 (+) Transcript_16633:182-1390(+)|eukprot:CAMPEP_0113969746 /NCGR_PEP_ID=MMETSP0011_2-20120614/10562_1 /TAXON_ID=101924 /ORGANISM="Rhodosorus marinus" /LENGTH=402 /DNA_ID=CAMNT_0000983585 /DNA_START=19 /DNA_END=1227 /DNA_ORIENTATION=+ /assembly_acc=CAM_ASM_000156
MITKLLELPDEILLRILEKLPVRQLICVHRWQFFPCEECWRDGGCTVPATCRAFKRFAQHDSLWRGLVGAYFGSKMALKQVDDDRMDLGEDGENICFTDWHEQRGTISLEEARDLLDAQLPHVEGYDLDWTEVFRRFSNSSFPWMLDHFARTDACPGWEVTADEGIISWEDEAPLGRDRAVRSSIPFRLDEMQSPTPAPRRISGTRDFLRSPAPGALCLRPDMDTGSKRLKVVRTHAYYYEVTVLGPRDALAADESVLPCICVGITCNPHEMEMQPGWTSFSFGIHSDDGNVFHGTVSENYVDAKFDVGDTIGCGILFEPGEGSLSRFQVFFTKNGKFLCLPFPRSVHARLHSNSCFYPVVGIDAHRIAFKANFGKSPFRYNPDLVERDLIPFYHRLKSSLP